MTGNSFGARGTLHVGDRTLGIFRLDAVLPPGEIARLPYSIRVLLENVLRNEDGTGVTAADVETIAGWRPDRDDDREIAFTPARVLMQDFTGVPALVDLAMLRDRVSELGGAGEQVQPMVPADLVIDHSISVDHYGVPDAFRRNAEIEFTRNEERYQFLRWGQHAFDTLRVVPPNTGICHQVNLEYLAQVVFSTNDGDAYPDTLVGTDSHTTMVNGLGVLGWGVGGIEAEAALLGQPMSMRMPKVIGFRLSGALRAGATATDLVLTVTERLRARGVVGKFVEFFGPGLQTLALPDRATIGNMSPEYGSTCAIFPIDDETLRYLRLTGRTAAHVALVEAYAKQQGLWHDPDNDDAQYTSVLELDLADVEPCLAGPSRPQDRVPLSAAKHDFAGALARVLARGAPATSSRPPGVPSNLLPAGLRDGSPEDASAQSFPASDPPAAAAGVTGEGSPDGEPAADAATLDVEVARTCVPVTTADGTSYELDHGHVVIAAITSCTNTSNPSVMLAAGLLAKRAVERGLTVQPWVKTSLAPGSRVVIDYYERAGLLPYLERLGFNLVGFGCTTCIGNSGPLPDEIVAAIDRGNLATVAVLSGNRNFEGRINPDVRMNYLASPPLVVAYALAGTMDIDLTREPLGHGEDGAPVYLADIWPSEGDLRELTTTTVRSEMFDATYRQVFDGDARWQAIDAPPSARFEWSDASTYIRLPPYLDGVTLDVPPIADIDDARVLALLGDSVTTDHISPAGVIRRGSPAAQWLDEHGVAPADYNSYGSRRGNHEVMMRGTFANVRLRNRLAPGTEGGVTVHLPDATQMSIYDAAVQYQRDGVPLVVVAGKEYGAGSSRDWAAKGTALLGVRAVLAESFERIHRSNLIGMGVLPLQFRPGESAESLGLTGHEVFTIEGLAALADHVEVRADQKSFRAEVRIDTPDEAAYFRHGGILPYVLRRYVGGR